LIWVALLEFLVVMFPLEIEGWDISVGPSVIVHVFLGAVIFVLALYNFLSVGKTDAPDRIKRITRVIVGFAFAAGVLGFLIHLDIGGVFVSLLHVVVSFAIITQASSAATGYDMWEEKEFVQATGETSTL